MYEDVSITKKIEEIYEVREEVLTEWEIGFIENVRGRPEISLSEKQIEIIKKLYEKVCKSPY